MRLSLLLQVGGFFPIGIFGRDGLSLDPFGHFVGFEHELLIVERGLEIPSSQRHGIEEVVPFGLDHGFTLLNARGIVMTAAEE